MKRVGFIIVLLMAVLSEVSAVVLPSSSYLGSEEQDYSEVVLSSGTKIKGNFLSLYEIDCSYPGEPTLCQNCCSSKVQSCIEHCEGNQACIAECAKSNLTCVDDCVKGSSLPLDSTLCGLLMSLAAIITSLIRLRKRVITKN